MPSTKGQRLNSRFVERGGLWVITQSALMLAVIAGGFLFPGDSMSPGWTIVGSAGVFAGALFGLAGIAVLKGNRTIFPKPRDGSALIRHGIYGYVRHPLYTSVILISVGWALCWGSEATLAVALIMVPFFHFKARVEERWLRRKFPEYDAYSREVAAFIPWLY